MHRPRYQFHKMKSDGDEASKCLDPTGQRCAECTHNPQGSTTLYLVEELDIGLIPIEPMIPETKAIHGHRDNA